MTERQAPAGSSPIAGGITAGGEFHPALRTQTAETSGGADRIGTFIRAKQAFERKGGSRGGARRTQARLFRVIAVAVPGPPLCSPLAP